jgi:predicted ester cyclase
MTSSKELERNKAVARAVFDVWSTCASSVEDQVAEGDRVVTRWRAEMTHTGNLGDLAATGRRVTITGITIDRFEQGKIVEAWRSMDTRAARR